MARPELVQRLIERLANCSSLPRALHDYLARTADERLTDDSVVMLADRWLPFVVAQVDHQRDGNPLFDETIQYAANNYFAEVCRRPFSSTLELRDRVLKTFASWSFGLTTGFCVEQVKLGCELIGALESPDLDLDHVRSVFDVERTRWWLDRGCFAAAYNVVDERFGLGDPASTDWKDRYARMMDTFDHLPSWSAIILMAAYLRSLEGLGYDRDVLKTCESFLPIEERYHDKPEAWGEAIWEQMLSLTGPEPDRDLWISHVVEAYVRIEFTLCRSFGRGISGDSYWDMLDQFLGLRTGVPPSFERIDWLSRFVPFDSELSALTDLWTRTIAERGEFDWLLASQRQEITETIAQNSGRGWWRWPQRLGRTQILLSTLATLLIADDRDLIDGGVQIFDNETVLAEALIEILREGDMDGMVLCARFLDAWTPIVAPARRVRELFQRVYADVIRFDRDPRAVEAYQQRWVDLVAAGEPPNVAVLACAFQLARVLLSEDQSSTVGQILAPIMLGFEREDLLELWMEPAYKCALPKLGDWVRHYFLTSSLQQKRRQLALSLCMNQLEIAKPERRKSNQMAQHLNWINRKHPMLAGLFANHFLAVLGESATSLRMGEFLIGIDSVPDSQLLEHYRVGAMFPDCIPLHCQRLVAAGKSRRAARLLEVGFNPATRDDDWPYRVDAVLSAYRRAGEFDRGYAFIEQYLTELDWFEGPNAEWIPELLRVSIASECIQIALAVDSAFTWDLCVRIAEVLRRRLSGQAIYVGDNDQALTFSAQARQLLSRACATFALRERDLSQRRVFRRHGVLWDSEFSQRQLLERMARSMPRAVLGIGPSLAKGWAAPNRQPHVLRRPEAHFPAAPASLKRVTAKSPRISPRVDRPLDRASPALTLPASGVSGREVAAALGDSLLLRAGFTLEGQLHWTLWRNEGHDLQVVADDGGAGPSDANDRLTAALERFDSTTDGLWEWSSASEDTRQRLRAAVASLRSAFGNPDQLRTEWTQFDERLATINNGDLGRSLRLWFGQPVDWNEKTPAIEEFTAWSRQHLVKPVDLASRLDQATKILLEAVAVIWPLEPLVAVLTAEDELILQVEGVLHSLPIPLLLWTDVDGQRRHLFERVRIIRTVLSPLTAQFLQTIDDRRIAEGEAATRVISFTALDSAKPVEFEVARMLHHDHESLTERISATSGRNYEWFSAFEDPPGRYDVLARGVAESGGAVPGVSDSATPGVALLSVCAHGIIETSGVMLSDALWDGATWRARNPKSDGLQLDPPRSEPAFSLESVDFLIQVSCSVGRVAQRALTDADGFCVRLAGNRARSVLAGRWQIHALHAARFAGWVAEEYLSRHAEAAAQGMSLSARKSRGEAVAAARLRWLKEGEQAVGLHTVAAFDLYGLS